MNLIFVKSIKLKKNDKYFVCEEQQMFGTLGNNSIEWQASNSSFLPKVLDIVIAQYIPVFQ